jgi:hypothetical protein
MELEELATGETSEELELEYSAGATGVSLLAGAELEVDIWSTRVLEGTPVLRLTLDGAS